MFCNFLATFLAEPPQTNKIIEISNWKIFEPNQRDVGTNSALALFYLEVLTIQTIFVNFSVAEFGSYNI